MTRLATIVLVALLAACSGDHSPEHQIPGVSEALNDFYYFPDSLFRGIYFQQDLSEAREELVREGFLLIDSSGSYHYQHPGDSIAIIIPHKSTIDGLKIVLKSKKMLDAGDELKAHFRSNASSFDETDEFSVYHFHRNKHGFKLSVFKQDDFIRLNFEQQLSK